MKKTHPGTHVPKATSTPPPPGPPPPAPPHSPLGPPRPLRGLTLTPKCLVITVEAALSDHG